MESYLEILQRQLRRELKQKTALRVRLILDNGNKAAISRAEKSIALRVFKLTCEHDINVYMTPGVGTLIKCRKCRSSVVG